MSGTTPKARLGTRLKSVSGEKEVDASWWRKVTAEYWFAESRERTNQPGQSTSKDTRLCVVLAAWRGNSEDKTIEGLTYPAGPRHFPLHKTENITTYERKLGVGTGAHRKCRGSGRSKRSGCVVGSGG